MNKVIGFLEEAPGVNSNTRLLISSLIAHAILGSSFILGVGLYKYIQPGSNENLLAIAVAAGTFVGSISGVAAAWKVSQKGKEPKSDSPTSTPPQQ